MKKLFLIVSLVLGLSAMSYAGNFFDEPAPSKTVVNDSTIIFYNVDKIEVKQSGKYLTCIIDVDTNTLVAKFEGSRTVELAHKGNYMVMSKKQFTKAETKTIYSPFIY